MAAKDTQGKTVFWRIAALLMLAAGIAAGWTLRGCSSGASGVMVADTITIIDTIAYHYPVPRDSAVVRYETVRLMVADTARVTVTDTVRVADSVEVVVPITQRVYGDSLYRAYVSGYRPRLDSIFIYHPTTVVTGVQKPEKIAIFAGVGGTGICGGFSPSLGIGAVVGGKYAIGADVGYHKGMTYGVKLGIRIN